MPHVDPLDRADLPQFEEKFARYDEIRGFLPNSILTMARRPNIAKAFMLAAVAPQRPPSYVFRAEITFIVFI